MRGVTLDSCAHVLVLHISTHTPHARRDLSSHKGYGVSRISTHTPHARRDIVEIVNGVGTLNFNSHASCEA